ncbi:MAG: hypothetical protein U0175_12290 [Caldilineaceae bacterium]
MLESIRSLEQQLQVLNAKLNATPKAPTDSPVPLTGPTQVESLGSL